MSQQIITLHLDERMPLEKAIRKFKRMCDSYGIVKEYRKRVEYKKPSIRAKEKSESAVKRKLKGDTRVKRFVSKI